MPKRNLTVSKYSAFVSKENGKLRMVLQEGLDFIDWKRFAKKDSTVFLKPNFTFPRYKEGVTTRPELLRCLLEILKDRCDQVIIGESDIANNSFKAEESFKGHNMYKIAKETGSELVSLSRLPSRFVESKIQSKKVKVQLPNMLLDEVDCFVSIPVMKVHAMTGVSLGIKNLWGCYPDSMRCLHHQNFDRKITLIAKLLKPKIVVIDGYFSLDGHGPMWGEPVKTDLILLSDNVVVSDALGSTIMGIPLKRAKHILTAEKEGLGTSNLDNIRLSCDWHQYVMQFHNRKTIINHAESLLFHNDRLAKLVMDSPLSPFLYGIARLLRTDEEKTMANQLKI